MTVEITKVGTAELWKQFQRNPVGMYTQTANRMKDAGIEEVPTLSRALDEMARETDRKPGEPDTFERMLMEAGIITRSDPMAGYWASPASKFNENAGTRALYTEFAARNWRKVSFGKVTSQERAMLLSSDGVVGSWERPYYDSATIRPNQQIAPQIPLSELVSMTTGITSDAYRSYYLTYDATALRKYRVGESAEIPVATLSGAEHSIRLHKYGRGIQMSYEAARNVRVDKQAFFIQWMALQSEIDKVAAVLNVIVNGDGNSNTTPTTYNLTTLDSSATAGTLTLKGWLAYKMKFSEPYVLTTSLMQDTVALQLALLNTGTANVPLVAANLGGLGAGITPINQFADAVRYGWTSDAPSLKIVGWDRRFCVERVTQIGAEIAEMERYINNQTNLLTMTETEGYTIMDGNSARILDVNA